MNNANSPANKTGKKSVRIFGIPMDLGQNRRGVDMGPSAIRYAGLQQRLQRLGYQTYDEGNILVPQAEQNPDHLTGKINAHYLPEITGVCDTTYKKIKKHLQSDDIGIFIGGDHSISIGTVAAVAKDTKLGVLWVDAHADMNTPDTSPSGNIHGMSLAALLGIGPDELVNVGYKGAKLNPASVAMVGVRDIDAEERRYVQESDVGVFTMRDIDEDGISMVAHQILERMAHVDRIHVSLDLDSCDPRIAPGVGTPVIGGLTYREAHLLMEILADSGKVMSMDVVEINPILDIENSTAKIAVDLIASLLGQRII